MILKFIIFRLKLFDDDSDFGFVICIYWGIKGGVIRNYLKYFINV